MTLMIGIFSAGFAQAQKGSINGVVADTMNHIKISNAVIYILRARDSILISFTRSKSDGQFEIKNLEKDSIIILVGYPNYADYSEKIDIDNDKTIYVAVPMTNKIGLLEEVILKGAITAIRIKGDTTEYNAASFNLPPNATAEDLLKKLPGIQVTKNGQITVQGEKVTKVLVDGEEFFSGDPTLVTQNLPSNMISKIQVFNQKSELSKLTGTNDGNSSKTINIKLKEDKKNGYFGKVDLGKGTNGYYRQKSFFNSFKAKRKFSLYSNISNTGKDAFNDELKSFTNNSLIDVNTNVSQLDSWSGEFNEKGLPSLRAGGLHYNNNFNADKITLNGDYKIQNLKLVGTDSSVYRYNLIDQKNIYKEKKIFNNKSIRNSLNAKYEVQIDSLTSLKVNFSGQNIYKESKYNFESESFANEYSKLNSENRNLSVSSNLNFLNSNILLTKKTKKPRRNILVSFSENYKKENSSGYLISQQKFFKLSSLIDSQAIDQFKKNDYLSLSMSSKFTYTEPISKNAFLLANVEYDLARNFSKLNSYNKSITGKYDSFDTLFSNNLKYNSNLLKWELGYTLIKSKYYLISSIGIGKSKYFQSNQNTLKNLHSSFTNLFPNFLVSYQLAAKKRVTLKYEGLVNNPSVNQVQETQINIDPLNIILGNPKLKPSFSNIYKLSYSDFKPSVERELTARLIYTSITNDIVYQSNIDSFGRKVFRFVNLNGNRNFNQNLSYSRKLNKDFYLNLNAVFKENRYVNTANDFNYVINSRSSDLSFSLSKSKDDKYDISIEFGTISSISKFRKQNFPDIVYRTYSITPNIDLYLPYKIKLHSDYAITFHQKNLLFTKNFTVLLWNASIEKMFLKNNSLVFKVYANDILNRNLGLSSDYNATYSMQNIYSVVKRYTLFSAIWNFNKNKVSR
jgi:hypothetical protein